MAHSHKIVPLTSRTDANSMVHFHNIYFGIDVNAI